MPVHCAENYSPDRDKPVMRIGAVADLLGVCPAMVRIYEERGLVVPQRRNNQRLYSYNDVCWLGRIRELINEESYDIDEIKRMMRLPACWKLLNCPEEVRATCPVAQAPGKRCWEVARQEGRSEACANCQIRRAAEEDESQ
ncbi:MAG: MerR family transcriptional regulator [candidate division WS1 bacterium]|jgi:DNA-binding transcriptional MerR regulator|nr:MerR family transcriptional regulator [candidate division WS1 bacterium]